MLGYGALGLALAVLGALAMLTRSPLATRLIVPRISDLTSTPVHADRAWIGLDGRIVLEGARFIVPGMARPGTDPGPEARFFEVERAVIWMDWGSLLGGVPIVGRVELTEPLFRLSQSGETGRLNIAGLSFLRPDAGLGEISPDFHLPVLATTGGIIELGEHTEAGYTVLKRLPVDGDLVPVAQPGGQNFAFRLRQTGDGLGKPPIDLRGRYDADGLSITLDEVRLSDWPADVVPTKVRAIYERLGLVGAIGQTTLRVDPSGKLSATMGLEGVGMSVPFDLSGQLIESGTVLRLEDTTGSIELSTTGVEADLRGVLNELAYEVHLSSDGLERTSPFRCVLTTNTRLERDMDLLFFAPRAVLKPLNKFLNPEADVEAVVRIERGPELTDGTPSPVRATGELRLSNGSAAYAEFPYRLTNLEGLMTFDETTLVIDWLRASHPNGTSLTATGRFSPMGPECAITLDIEAVGVPVDDALRDAMSPGRRQMVDALFNEARYRELVAAGLVVSPQERARREEMLALGQQEREAWRAGGIALADATEPDAGPPGFSFGGRADVQIHLERAFGRKTVWTSRIDVHLPEAGLVAEHFPLPMIARDVHLVIDDSRATLAGGVYEGAAGGTATVEATVELGDDKDPDSRDSVPEVRILASGIPIDDRLLAAIPGYGSSPPDQPGTLRDVLDRLRLSGTADCEAVLGPRADGSLGYDVRATVSGLAARPAPLGEPASDPALGPLRLWGVDGTIAVREDRIALDLSGELSILEMNRATRPAPCPLALQVVLDFHDERTGFTPAPGDSNPQAGPPRPGPDLRARVTSRGLDLNAPLEHVIAVFSREWADTAAAWRQEHRPDGVVDARVDFEGNVAGAIFAEIGVSGVQRLAWGRGEDRVSVGASEGEVTVRTGPRPWVRAEGLAAPLRLGNEPAGMVRAQGQLPLVRGGDAPPTPSWDERMELVLEGARFESPVTRRLIAQRLGEGALGEYDRRRPSGVYELRVQAVPQGANPALGEGELGLPALAMTGAVAPQSIAFDRAGGRTVVGAMDGLLRFGASGGVIESLSAAGQGWRVRAEGRWTTGPDGALGIDAALDGKAETGLPADLVALLPEGVGEAIVGLGISATGPVAARDVVLSLARRSQDAPPSYDVSGLIAYQDAAARAGVEITEAHGRVGFEASGDGQAGSFAMDVHVDRALAAGVRLSEARARVISGRAPGEVMVPSIEAVCHGGRIAGSAQVRGDGPQRRYWTELVASGVRAGPVFADLGVGGRGEVGPVPDRPWNDADDLSRGVLEGSFSLSGVVGDPSARAGRGEVQVAGGRVLELPGLMQLIEFSNLQAPMGERLNTAQAAFFIDGPTLTFEQLSALSSSVEIFGFGTMAVESHELDLRFNSRAVRPIPVLSDVLEGLRDELITTRVRGTPGAMELSTEQLSGTRRIIRSLFGGVPSSEERRMQEIQERARDGQSRALRAAARAEDRASLAPRSGTVHGPSAGDDDAPAPTLVVQPTDDP